MSLLEQYRKQINKVGLNFEVAQFSDCNSWVHLLLVLSHNDAHAPCFREIMVSFDESYGYQRLLDTSSSSERHLILLSMGLCEWFYLKDVEVDFRSQPLSSRLVESFTGSPLTNQTVESLSLEESKADHGNWKKTLA